MAYKCKEHGKLPEEGKDAVTPIFWTKAPLCPLCIENGSKSQAKSFTVHKLEVV